jgi:hypothetical protein
MTKQMLALCTVAVAGATAAAGTAFANHAVHGHEESRLRETPASWPASFRKDT